MKEGRNAELSHHLMRKLGEKMKSQLRQSVRFKSSGGNVSRKNLTHEIKQTAQGTRKKKNKPAKGRMGKGEMHRMKSLSEQWTQGTAGVSLGGFSDLPHKSPTLVATFPSVDSSKWQINEFNGPELSSAIGSCPSGLQPQPQREALNRLWDSFSFHSLHLPKAVQSPSRLLTQYIFLLSFTF